MPRRHALLATAIMVVWGVNFVAIHYGLQSFPPLLFAALRFTCVGVLGLPFVGRPQVPWKMVLLIGLFLSAGQFGLLFTSMHLGMPAGLASLVTQMQVVFTLILAAVFLGERATRARLFGIGVALGGIVLIAVGRNGSVPLGALLLCIGGAASWGVGNIFTRIARPPDAMAILVWSSLVAPLPLALLSLTLEGPAEWSDAFGHIELISVFGLAYVVVLASVFGYGSWTWLLRQHEATKVAPFTLLVPVTGIGAAWILLGERPNLAELAGAVIVILGLLIGLRAVPERPRVEAEVLEPVGVPVGPVVTAR